jgi:hypothetical protein
MLSLLEANIVGEPDPSDDNDPSSNENEGGSGGMGGGGLEGLMLLAAEVGALLLSPFLLPVRVVAALFLTKVTYNATHDAFFYLLFFFLAMRGRMGEG